MGKIKKIKEWKNGAKAPQFYLSDIGNPIRISDNVAFYRYKAYKADGYVNGTVIYLRSFDEDMIHVVYKIYRDLKIVGENAAEINNFRLIGDDTLYIMPPEPQGG